MKAVINHVTRIVAVSKDSKGLYCLLKGKRVYLEEYRGVLYPRELS